MKTLLWLAAGGLGLYILDQMGYLGTTATTTATSTAPATSSSPQANTSTSASTTTAASTNNAPTLAQVQAYLLNAAASDANFSQDSQGNWTASSAYHWSYYVNAIVPATANMNLNAIFPGVDLTQPMGWTYFWNGMGPYLTSNYGLSGLGLIANHVNPYLQGPRGDIRQIFGAGLAPTGPETMIIRRSNG